MSKGTCIGKRGPHHLGRQWQPLRTVTAWASRHQGQEKQIKAGDIREGDLVSVGGEDQRWQTPRGEQPGGRAPVVKVTGNSGGVGGKGSSVWVLIYTLRLG